MEFTVSGEGQLPRDTAAGTGAAPGAAGGATGGEQPAQGTAATDTRPGGGLGTPIDPEGTNDPWAKYKWWILGGLGLALATGAGIMLKGSGPKDGSAAPVNPLSPVGSVPVAGPNTLLQVLKDELFAVETERLQGKLSDTQYAELKAALEIVLRRALARIEGTTGASNP